MNQLLKEKNYDKKRILIAPLDWGLGHVTRCIPIIKELMAQGCDVWLAGEGAQEILLKEKFPQLSFLHLEGYRIKYAKTGAGLMMSMFRQTKKIYRSIRKEHEWLKEIIAEYDFDAVISDNRFGLYHDAVPCIFITHQLTIKSPLGKWFERILQKRNYRYINMFSACWVPDDKSKHNLAGDLSHPQKKPVIPVHYIGILSRFDSSPAVDAEVNKENLLIVLSGPEPQRSILEEKIIKEISHYHSTATIVRGLPGSSSLIPSSNMIQFYNHLPADELKKEMIKAEFVIGRCGYSSVMDIAVMGKKSILIPTPGQTEQEYLAKYLQQKKFAYTVSQKEFTLDDALKKAKQFDYIIPPVKPSNSLQQIVTEFISSLSKK